MGSEFIFIKAISMFRIVIFLIVSSFFISVEPVAQCPLNIDETTIAPSDDLLLYFPFDGDANNLGDPRYSASVNGAEYVESLCGQGLDFDGDDDYVLVSPTLFLDQDYTVTAWINARDFADAMGIFSIRDQCSSTYRGYSISQLNIGDYNIKNLNNQVNRHVDCVGFSGGDRYLDESLVLPANEFVFVALTVKNNGSEDRKVDLFVNCEKLETEMVLDFPTMVSFDSLLNYQTTIGASSSVSGFESSFNGVVDELRVYDRVLTQQELLDVYRECEKLSIGVTRYTNCEFDSAVIEVSNTEQHVEYQLYDINSDLLLDSALLGNCGSLIFSTSLVDTLTAFTVIATDTLSGCSIRLDSTILLEPFGVPVANFTLPNFVCRGDSAQITYEGDSSITREWRLSTPVFQDSVLLNRDTFMLNFVDTGRYSVSLIIRDENGCVDTISKEISIDAPLVIADFSAVPFGCAESIPIQITERSISQDSIEHLREWSFFDPSDSLVSTTRPFSITEPGDYTIVLRVTDSRGCMDSTSMKISSPLIGLGCCPDFDLDPVDACNPDRIEICGQTNLDSCIVDYLYAEYTFTYDDTVEIVERVPWIRVVDFAL